MSKFNTVLTYILCILVIPVGLVVQLGAGVALTALDAFKGNLSLNRFKQLEDDCGFVGALKKLFKGELV